MKKREKELFSDFVGAYKSWRSARKEAKKAGEDFDEPKPKKPIVRKISRKRVSGKDKAEGMASLYQEKWDAKQRKKEEKALNNLVDDESDEKPEKKWNKKAKAEELKDDEGDKKKSKKS